jgi:transcriptional regulator with XRE-family HTH domain
VDASWSPAGRTECGGPPGTGTAITRKAGMMTDGATLRRRVIGAALRRYRETLGYPLEDAASILDCDRSKISRIENGIRAARLPELRQLLTEYGAEPADWDILKVIAGRNAGHGWWDEYADVLPADLRDYLVLETAAVRVLVYEPQRIPALLQTEPYAYALAAADSALAAGSQHRAAEAAIIRQQAVLDQGRLEITAVLGEAALYQQVGGAAVMGSQLGQLAAFAEDLPQVTVQVLPVSRGAHAASGSGPAAVLELGGNLGLGVVHLGSLAGDIYLADPAAVARHASLFPHVQTAALPPVASAQVIRDIAAGHRPEPESA